MNDRHIERGSEWQARGPADGARSPAGRGFALIAVLWLVAALTLTVSGVLYAARGEVRSASWHKERSVLEAASDGAALLVARQLAAATAPDAQTRAVEVDFDDHRLRVVIVPLDGLIDLNSAPESLLADLLAIAGGVERPAATVLAQRIVDWRDPDDVPLAQGAEDDAYIAAQSPFRTRGDAFDSPEDLLQVLGFDFALYERLRGLLTVESNGGGRVNPLSAPPAVLRVLAGGDEAVARQYEQARSVDGALADSTRLRAEHTSAGVGNRFLIEVHARLSNGASLVSRRFMSVGAAAGEVPWLTLRIERLVQAGDED